jgi:hypothetical protein
MDQVRSAGEVVSGNPHWLVGAMAADGSWRIEFGGNRIALLGLCDRIRAHCNEELTVGRAINIGQDDPGQFINGLGGRGVS